MNRARRWWMAGVLALCLGGLATTANADTLELLSGARLDGRVVRIDKQTKEVTFESLVGERKTTRTYPYSRIHAVVMGEKRYVLTARPNKTGAGGATSVAKGARSRKEVDELIASVGRTPPEWYESTPLEHPPTLDLTWPEKPEGGWDNQKNVGQYIWDVINPNPGKWRQGVRLMHFMLQEHQNDPAKRVRAMNELGRMYHDLLVDYARAAFWWRQAKVDQPSSFHSRHAALLAGCYARLGNRAMAVELLEKLEKRTLHLIAVKVWADIGETDRAVRLCSRFAKSSPADAAMYAADACRVGGRLEEAIVHYRKVLATPASGQRKGWIERLHARAQSNLEAIELYELSDVKNTPDGQYVASSLGYEGPVQVEVAVEKGKITRLRVVDHREKQFYSAMTDTPAKIIAKQSVQGIDATSNATITSEAIINATAKALAEAARTSKGDQAGDSPD